MIYKLDDLYIKKFLPERATTQMRKLNESEWYHCLVALGKGEEDNSLKIFLDHCEVIEERNNETRINYKEFISLYKNIMNEGYNLKLKPQFQISGPYDGPKSMRQHRVHFYRPSTPTKFLIHDGQHRAAILLYLAELKGSKEIML